MVLFTQTQFLDIFEPIIDTHFSDRVFAGDKPVREIIPIVIVLGSKNTSEASWHHSNKALVVGSIQAWRNWGWFRIYLSCSNDALRVDLEWFSQSMQEEKRRTWLNSGKSWSKTGDPYLYISTTNVHSERGHEIMINCDQERKNWEKTFGMYSTYSFFLKFRQWEFCDIFSFLLTSIQ